MQRRDRSLCAISVSHYWHGSRDSRPALVAALRFPAVFTARRSGWRLVRTARAPVQSTNDFFTLQPLAPHYYSATINWNVKSSRKSFSRNTVSIFIAFYPTFKVVIETRVPVTYCEHFHLLVPHQKIVHVFKLIIILILTNPAIIIINSIMYFHHRSRTLTHFVALITTTLYFNCLYSKLLLLIKVTCLTFLYVISLFSLVVTIEVYHQPRHYCHCLTLSVPLT